MINTQLTLEDLVQFLQAAQPKVYPGWNFEQLEARICIAMQDKLLGVVVHGPKLLALAVCSRTSETEIHAEAVRSIKPLATLALLHQLFTIYPTAELTAKRHGRLVRINNQKLKDIYGRWV